MRSSCCPAAKSQTLKVLCARVCVFYSTVCLAGWPLCTDAARLRCGSDLLSDLIFVCGDRGIYLDDITWRSFSSLGVQMMSCGGALEKEVDRDYKLHSVSDEMTNSELKVPPSDVIWRHFSATGKGKWSGYGARPRGKGIVDQCCRPAGCDLHHLEMYCAKPKSQQQATASPATSTAPDATAQAATAQQFEAVFQKRLLGHLGPPNSPKREAYRKKPTPSLPKKNKASPSRRGINTQDTTSRPPSASRSPLQRTLLLVTS